VGVSSRFFVQRGDGAFSRYSNAWPRGDRRIEIELKRSIKQRAGVRQLAACCCMLQAHAFCICISLWPWATNFSSHSNIDCGYSDVGIAPQQQALCSEGIVRITCFASDRAGNATSAAAMMRVFSMVETCTFVSQFISP
jgi:hypothetical protein